jgi:hypothetical protein
MAMGDSIFVGRLLLRHWNVVLTWASDDFVEQTTGPDGGSAVR